MHILGQPDTFLASVASLRADGFGGLRGSGEATTVMLTATGANLIVTADVLAVGGFVVFVPTPEGAAGVAAPPVTKVKYTGLTKIRKS